jgi:hypothetical protein
MHRAFHRICKYILKNVRFFGCLRALAISIGYDYMGKIMEMMGGTEYFHSKTKK